MGDGHQKCPLIIFIPDGLEWNGKTEGFFVEWLSYFVLSPEGSCDSRARMGSNCFYLYFNCCLDKVSYLSKILYYNGLTELLKIFYCPGVWVGWWVNLGEWAVIFYRP